MKYCLSSRQNREYLLKADEIKVKYKDKNVIFDLTQKYPKATIILETPFDPTISLDWDEMKRLNILAHENFILCLANLRDVEKCKENNIKFYFGLPISSFYELQSLKNLGVCYFRLAPPAFFELDKVKNLGVPVRAVPNLAYDNYFPHENGICGSWIRPEDTELYSDYIETYEFEGVELNQERALWDIYNRGEWKGNLNHIFINFNFPADNTAIPQNSIAIRRLTCGQKCQSGSNCNLCERYLKYAQKSYI